MTKRRVRKDLPFISVAAGHYTEDGCTISHEMMKFYGEIIDVKPNSTPTTRRYEWWDGRWYWRDCWLEPPFEYSNEEEL